jgi:hypothetical protein
LDEKKDVKNVGIKRRKMRRIDVVIATRGRFKKLMRMLESIPPRVEGMEIRIKICVDNDAETYERIKVVPRLEVFFMPKQAGNVYCRNFLLEKTEDAAIYAVDDIVFKPRSIETAVEEFKREFPDDFGVLGFSQDGNTFHPTGVAMVGGPFLDRYPQRHLFCPEYFHFAAQEVYAAAVHWGRFFLSRRARVYHFHPVYHQEEMDETHREARVHKHGDMRKKREREARGEIWGIR